MPARDKCHENAVEHFVLSENGLSSLGARPLKQGG